MVKIVTMTMPNYIDDEDEADAEEDVGRAAIMKSKRRMTLKQRVGKGRGCVCWKPCLNKGMKNRSTRIGDIQKLAFWAVSSIRVSFVK